MTTSHVILFYLIAILLSSLAVLRRSWYTSTLTDKEYAAFDFPISVFCLAYAYSTKWKYKGSSV